MSQLAPLIMSIYIIAPVSVILTIMGIYNIMSHKANDEILRLIWVIILIFIPVFGFLFYLFLGIKQLK